MKTPSLNLENLRKGDRRELSRWFSAVDRGDALPSGAETELWKEALNRKVPVFGFNGPPGAGKSSFLRTIVKELAPLKTLVLCIDPSSPLTGGAFLGDRVRLQQGADLPDTVFIRSVGSHGAAGAVTPALDAMIAVGKNAAFEVILIEGVGAGQAEYALRDFVDHLVLLMVPESGDSVQMQKAGVLELADAMVLNKKDRPGADALWQNLKDDFSTKALFETNSLTGEGVAGVVTWMRKMMSSVQSNKATTEALARRFVSRLSPIIQKKCSERMQRGKVTVDPHLVLANTETAVEHFLNELFGDSQKK